MSPSPIHFRPRRCQQCGVVRPTETFKRAGMTTTVFGNQYRVRCPACGYVAPLWAFPTVELPEPGAQNEAT